MAGFAKQSTPPLVETWIALSLPLPAMPAEALDSNLKHREDVRPHSRDAMRPSFGVGWHRAGKTGCALRPRSRVQLLLGKTSRRAANGWPGIITMPPAPDAIRRRNQAGRIAATLTSRETAGMLAFVPFQVFIGDCQISCRASEIEIAGSDAPGYPGCPKCNPGEDRRHDRVRVLYPTEF